MDKERQRERTKAWYQANRERLLQRKWHTANREQSRAYGRAYYQANKERVKARNEANRKANRAKLNQRARLRRATDPNFRLRCSLRSRLNEAMHSNRKSASTFELLGCTIDNLWTYLESKFTEGMTRANYATHWEVDHIIPCALFDLSKPDHQKRCFHFSNLQPLPCSVNRSKGAKYACTS